MKPILSAPRLLPLLAGAATASLGPEDLREIGVSAVAVDIVELAVGLGLERIERLGGLSAFLAWDRPVVAIAGWSTAAPATTGRRSRTPPQLLSERDGVLLLRSAIDGGTIQLARRDLAAWADRLGAEPASSIAGEGLDVASWDDGDPPPGQLIVSGLAQRQAHEGRFWDGAGWSQLGSSPADAGNQPMREDCSCRGCAIATRGYLSHLWKMREITAEHLLCWHNLHQIRIRIEETPTA